MIELSHESLSNIVYLVQNQNYSNIKARLDLKLPGDDSKMFSRIDIMGSWASWMGEDDIQYKSYPEANEIEKEEIATYMEEVKKRAQDNLGEQMPYIQDLFRVPSEKQIYWYRNGEGCMRVTLSQWGFKPATQEKQTDIIDMLINLPRKHTQCEVIVHIDFSDGTVAGLEDFELTLFGNTSQRRTDEKGNYLVGKLYKGKTFSVKSQHGESFNFTVDSSCTIYSCVFKLYTDYEISVVNQEQTPKPGYTLTINDVKAICDQEGKVAGKDYLLTLDNKQLKVIGESEQKEVYTLEQEPEKNKFTFQIKDTFEASLKGLVRYDDGEPLPKYEVEVEVDGKNRQCLTDDNGAFCMCNLEEGMTVSLYDVRTGTKTASSTLTRGENTCELIINKEKPVRRIVKIQVLGYKKEMLDGVKVTVVTPKGEYVRTTDEQGCIELPVECFEHKKKNKISFHLTKEYLDDLKNKPKKQ